MAKKQTEDKVVYNVVILRKDHNHVVMMESTNFDACLARWEALQAQWAECVKEVKPFVIRDPLITAFEPALIHEITLAPVMKESLATTSANNPYYRNMVQSGLAHSLSNQDLLARATRQEY